MSDELPKIGSRWRLRVWISGTYDYAKERHRDGRYAPNRMTKNIIEILSLVRYHDSNGEEQICFAYVVRVSGGPNRNGYNLYRVDNIGFIGPETLDYCWREEVSA